MKAIKHIPNLLTLTNLLFGILAIIQIVQAVDKQEVYNQITLVHELVPKEQDLTRLVLATYLLLAAGICDFLDGFAARLLKAKSAIGAQLDSLADMVSFGVAPALILYQLLAMSYASENSAIGSSNLTLLPALLFALAACFRLAKFNVDKEQTEHFKGLPTPAATLFVVCLPFFVFNDLGLITELTLNYNILVILSILLSILMVSNLPIIALKFKGYSFKDNWFRYLPLGLGLIGIVAAGAVGLFLTLIIYVLISLLLGKKLKTINFQ